MEKTNNYLGVRMDNNIVLNGLDLVKSFGKDNSLIFDILIYSGLNEQQNLFGFKEFDLYEFCDVMGYQHKNLTKTHPSPLWETNKRTETPYTSIFENALYRMSLEPLTFSKQIVDYTNQTKKEELNSYLLIDGLAKISFKRKDKFKYEYRINRILKEHMNLYFSEVDIESIKKLRKPKAVFLYLYILNLRDQYLNNRIEKVTPYFDYAVKQAQIEAKENSKKKQKLEEKIHLINDRTSINVKPNFFNKSGKSNYGLELIFEEDQDFYKRKKRVIEQVFEKTLIYNLIELYKEVQSIIFFDKEKFMDWVKSGNVNQKEKLNCYIATVMIVKKYDFEVAKRRCMHEAYVYFNITK